VSPTEKTGAARSLRLASSLREGNRSADNGARSGVNPRNSGLTGGQSVERAEGGTNAGCVDSGIAQVTEVKGDNIVLAKA